MPTDKELLVVTVHEEEGSFTLNSSAGSICVTTNCPQKANFGSYSDFVAWFFLPVAMRLNSNLHIEGRGTSTTSANARRISQIWESWLPGHLYAVDVSFSDQTQRAPPRSDRPLLYFSGGLDATYTSLKRLESGDVQDVLTIQGMDYSLSDQKRFEALVSKTAVLANILSPSRIIVRSNAYTLYESINLNLKGHHLSHIFAIAGAGFAMSREYGDLILAADDRLDAQFLTFPWGTNAATNPLFTDGFTSILTDSESVTRPEKIELVAKSLVGTQALSFCWNRKIQPDNCGVCEKCLRTKLLFIAVTGSLPPIFIDNQVPTNWIERLRFREPAGFQAVQEILYTAATFQNTDQIKYYVQTQAQVFDYYARDPRRRSNLTGSRKGGRQLISKLLQRIKRLGRT